MTACDSIMRGLDEALAFARGDRAGATVHETAIQPVDVAAIRGSTGLSQGASGARIERGYAPTVDGKDASPPSRRPVPQGRTDGFVRFPVRRSQDSRASSPYGSGTQAPAVARSRFSCGVIPHSPAGDLSCSVLVHAETRRRGGVRLAATPPSLVAIRPERTIGLSKGACGARYLLRVSASPRENPF